MDGKKVLIVDCDRRIKKEFLNSIQFPGFSFVEAENATAALKVLSSQKIDIVILNITQACAKELDLISYIKVNMAGCEIIVLAEISEIEIATRAVRHGAYLYLVKPVSPEDMKLVIEKVSIRLDDGVYRLDAEIEHNLSEAALEALDNGVPLTMETHVQVRRDGAWILPVVSDSYRWRFPRSRLAQRATSASLGETW